MERRGRLSRNAAFLFNLRDSGVKFQALDIPEANTLTLGVVVVLAQHEREIISARTRDALAARRARGLPLGTPRDLSSHAVLASGLAGIVNAQKANTRAALVAPAIAAARIAVSTSLRQVAAHLDEMGVTTPRGRKWTLTAVANAERLIANLGVFADPERQRIYYAAAPSASSGQAARNDFS